MIEIAAAVCLIASPDRCKEVSLIFEAEAITTFSCMMYGQGELAKWAEDHPNWRINRWSCRPAGRVAKI